MSKFYITTAIAYVNGKPHIGHTLEFVFADIIARYHRLKGDDTRLLTGTDEHGSKIYKMAVEEGKDVQEIVDENVGPFKDIWKKINGSNDDFIRTTDDLHKKGATKLWKLLEESGDIYEDEYEGLYCVGCEAYVQLKDLVDGNCPNHLKPPEKVKERNYFFKLSKYSDEIKKLIESDELKIYPDARKNEVLSLLEQGLKDVSFSRPKEVLPWGVEVPGDKAQVMYVWCDALSNYLTALGYADDSEMVQKYWPADMHVIGKDILRFHAGIWIGMLLSAGLPLPKSIGVHGFVTSEGHKMSKSLGNVVDPFETIDEYGVDAVRYYLAREVPTGDDGDFSQERFRVVYGSELANNLGNLVNRVTVMIGKYLDGKVPELSDFEFESDFEELLDVYKKAIEGFDLKSALEKIVAVLSKINTYIEDTKPWALAKEEKLDELEQVLANMLEGLRRSAILLWPFIPESAEKILEAIGYELEMDLEKDMSNKIDQDQSIVKPEVLFPRLED